jgi:hypothetical protein
MTLTTNHWPIRQWKENSNNEEELTEKYKKMVMMSILCWSRSSGIMAIIMPRPLLWPNRLIQKIPESDI